MAKIIQRPKCTDFGFKLNDSTVFSRPQWKKFPVILFVVYRLIVALYVSGFYLANLIVAEPSQNATSLMFLTTWAFLVFIMYNLVAVFNVIFDNCRKYHGQSDNSAVTVIFHKVHWFLFDVTTNVNFIVTLVYWTILYRPGWIPFVFDFTLHMFTSIVCLIDLCLAPLPVRIAHCVYPIVFGSVYGIFTVIFWACGGNDSEPIYPFLDYSNEPAVAAGAMVGVLFAVILMQLLIWAGYQLKLWLVRRYTDGDDDDSDDNVLSVGYVEENERGCCCCFNGKRGERVDFENEVKTDEL